MSRRQTLTLAEECPKLDANRLERSGFFTPGCVSEGKYLTSSALSVGLRAEPSHVVVTIAGVATTVALERRARHLGGTQTYFVCPRCSRLLEHLYVLRGRLACRWCFKLTYRCKRYWNKPQPLRVARLRARLGAEPGIGGPPPPRPYKCRIDYYDAWLRKLAALEAEALAAFRATVAKLEREKDLRNG
jgi:hypothetical protein